mgnify:CR=1 FL=1
MNNKVLIELYVPLIEEEFEVWVPVQRKIGDVIDLLYKSINELIGGYYLPPKKPSLYDRTTGKVIDVNLNVKEASIKNSSKLILI